MKVGDKVKIIRSPYTQELFEIGTVHTVDGYLPEAPYGVYIDGWPFAKNEVELVDESR